ncbi:DUF4440 domain-containing protein [Marinilongibacter aquaticus]|uniref:YybH family protein n=1 Tax=Marinilongibacter aquaticus TaxID=2975157 RepID=UPI0021BD3DE6|nr:DUF4440 domain-containing protein [Marinilongibacter aquaticus]UBM57804.1 DUF4440 domain-containing protein [Marinilongibacter aquaticus]
MLKQFFFILCVLSSFSGFAQSTTEEIKQILYTQSEDWNRGDIQAFMKGYWKNEGLLFIGKSGVQRGWQQTYTRYLNTYSSKALMGTLTFSELEIDELAEDAAWVLGKWHLKRPEEGDIGGYFTLLFKKIDGEWKIVADHTS